INVPSNLSKLLGKSALKTFMVNFWLTHKSLTASEFDSRWAALREAAIAKNKTSSRYIGRVYKHRHQWASFQVGVLFTAGMQSTQRVEGMHHLIKIKGKGKSTLLKDLFDHIQERLKEEELTERDLQLQDNIYIDSRQLQVEVYFPGVIEMNNIYLGRFAKQEMLKEMSLSSKYIACTIKLGEAIGWEILKPPTLETAMALGDDDRGLSEDEADIELRDDEDYVPDPEHIAAVERDCEYRKETTRAALAMYLMELGVAKIEAVFEITFEVPPYLNQYVILLKDRSHICTCLEIVNKGIPCGHFFRAMRHDRRVQYHIRMVLLRWFREDMQDDPDIVEKIKELPFTLSTTHNISVTGAVPDRRYLDDYSTIVPQAEVVARARKPLSNTMQLYAILHGKFKGINQDAVKSKEAYAHVNRTLDELNAAIASIAAGEYEDREIEDAQGSYLSNNDDNYIVHRLDGDKITKSRRGGEKTGSGATLRPSPVPNHSPCRNPSRSRGPSPNQTQDSSPNQTQDSSPAPTLAD
ncbi:hypothetical protein BGX27_004691, partial [Mortierella sp. AM989]